MTYDFVVVGGGSAGAVVAARLSEAPDARVLLVEAGGPDEGDIFEVPSLWGKQFETKWDWDYRTEPEPYLNYRTNYVPRGKALGGSSSMNAMLYVRGVPLDFDEWRAQGCIGWSWSEMLPYFKRAERNLSKHDELHGQDGPLTVSDRISENPIVNAWVAAAQAMGYPFNPDFNGVKQDGVGYFQLTQRDGRRASTSTAYLKPAAGRPNLEILTHAHARRILFEENRATGVEIERFGEVKTISAAAEIVVCAGAHNSPQILLLSGIGPARELAALGIKPLVDLPVGENLQEHPAVALVIDTDRDSLFETGDEADWNRYRKGARGPVASNVVEAGGFFRTRPSLPTPDVEIVVLPSMFRNDGLGAALGHAYTMVPQVLKPAASGKISLRSAEPTAKPRIFHNHFSTEEDRIAIREGVRISMRIAEQSPLREYERGRRQYPSSPNDAEIDEFVAEYGFGVFHPSSSCSMGRVVDHDLRVRGVDGLRVADASIMPSVVRGNPNASIIAIGEKAADLIQGNR
jgi:choline dehydrogenase